MARWIRSFTALVLAVSSLPACDDVATVIDPTPPDGPDVPPPPPPAPGSVRIVFPPGPSATDAASVHVRGTGVDLAAVTVNGIAATSDDGFATWIAEIPLTPGDNAVVIATRDDSGVEHAEAARTRIVARPVELRPTFAGRLALSPGGRIITSSGTDVHAQDLATGRRSVLARGVLRPRTDGSGFPRLGAAIALDAVGAHLYSYRPADGVVDVDLATGAATTIATTLLGADARGIALDEPRGRVLLATAAGVVAIELATGAATTVLPDDAHDVVIHAGRAFVLADGPMRASLITLDLATSAVTRAGAGGPLAQCCGLVPAHALAVDPASGTVYASKFGQLAILSPGPVRQFGPASPFIVFTDYAGLAVDGNHMIASVATSSGALTAAIDLATAAPTVIEDAQLGSGVSLFKPVGIGALPDGDVAIWDYDVVRIGADLGRAIVAERRFSGDHVRIVGGLALYDESNTISNDVRQGLTALDIATGEVAMTSSETIGSGPVFDSLRVIAAGSLAGEVFGTRSRRALRHPARDGRAPARLGRHGRRRRGDAAGDRSSVPQRRRRRCRAQPRAARPVRRRLRDPRDRPRERHARVSRNDARSARRVRTDPVRRRRRPHVRLDPVARVALRADLRARPRDRRGLARLGARPRPRALARRLRPARRRRHRRRRHGTPHRDPLAPRGADLRRPGVGRPRRPREVARHGVARRGITPDSIVHERPAVERASARGRTTARGADIELQTSWGATALEWAATLGSKDVGRVLLERGARGLNLFTAAGLGMLDVVASYFKHGPPGPEAGRGLREGDEATNIPLDSAVMKGDAVSDAFYIACRSGELAIAQLLHANGADINAKGYFGATGLHWAAHNGHGEVVRWLLDRGADANGRDIKVHATPAGWAMENGHRELAQLIVENGANVDVREAANYGLIDRVRTLIDEDPTRVNERGEWGTPLHEAVFFGHTAIVELLLSRGADPAITTCRSETAHDLAESRKHPEIAALLARPRS